MGQVFNMECQYEGDSYKISWVYYPGHPGGLEEPPEDDMIEITSILRNEKSQLLALVRLLNESQDYDHPFHKAIEQAMNVYWANQADARYESYKEIEDIFDEEAKDQQEQANQ